MIFLGFVKFEYVRVLFVLLLYLTVIRTELVRLGARIEQLFAYIHFNAVLLLTFDAVIAVKLWIAIHGTLAADRTTALIRPIVQVSALEEFGLFRRNLLAIDPLRLGHCGHSSAQIAILLFGRLHEAFLFVDGRRRCVGYFA